MTSETMSIANSPEMTTSALPQTMTGGKMAPLKEFLSLRSPVTTTSVPDSNPMTELTDLLSHIIANGLEYAATRCQDVAAQDASKMQRPCNEVFETAYPERFLLHEYVLRFVRHTRFSTHSYSLALVYLDRLADKGYQITRFNIHKLFAVSVVIASKYLDDRCHTNQWCAKVTGVPTETFNLMELYFLEMFNFTVFCAWEDLQIYAAQVGHILCTHLQLLRRKPDVPVK